MTRTSELILDNISRYSQGVDQGKKDSKTAITLFGEDLYQDDTFTNWVMTGFEAAIEDGRPIALIAIASNFIRLGYEVAMAELGEKEGAA